MPRNVWYDFRDIRQLSCINFQIFESAEQKLIPQLRGIQLIDIAVNKRRVYHLLKMISYGIDLVAGLLNLRPKGLSFPKAGQGCA
jgi:hypothetical protein